ncbi:ribbon-helix-helix protein, CopG family [Singulisphaera sp. PoT]|uniref:ribbon-helix-helix protein, CopG family n=1 Tax=Singulisphaera sp. PoT TaxID=3411797 RepID=UPI003BF4B3A8
MSSSRPVGGGASRSNGNAANARTLKASKPSKRPRGKSVRLQVTLPEETVKRLGVHSALAGVDQTAIVEEILSKWLKRYGLGRVAFGDPIGEGEESETVVDLVDLAADQAA